MGRGRRRLTVDEKIARGTLNVTRERQYREAHGLGPLRVAVEIPSSAPEPLAQPGEDRPYEAIAAQYVADVLAGRIVACKWVRAACRRQQEDLARQQVPSWGYKWEPITGAEACRFVEALPHVEGNTWATPTLRLEPWQVFLVMALFGWRKKGNRAQRRFTNFYLEVGRKSAKTTLLAGLAYYHLLREGEVGAQVICAASTGGQARIVFDIMHRMAQASPWLRQQGVQALANTILTADGGRVKPVNSKATSLDGLNPSCIILDESHTQDVPLHDVLKSAQGSRGNPLMMCPTTAGYDLLSVGYAMRGQVTKLLDGLFRADHLLGVIYTIDEADDWRDPAVWVKALPMLGISPKFEYVAQYCEDAKQTPSLEGEFKIKLCSLWSHSSSAWLVLSQLDKCADPTLKVERFLGQRCWIGADLAECDDLTAVQLVFEEGGVLYAFLRCYLPMGVVEERARAVPEYLEWVKAGILIMTDGAMTDHDRVAADIEADCLRYQVQQVVFDKHHSAQIASKLAAKGIPAIVEAKTANTATAPAKELEARIRHGKFRYDGNSCFRWQAATVVVERRVDGSLIPKKDRADSPNKIDAVDALVSAIGAWLRGAGKKAGGPQIFILGGKPNGPR
jgi:phage terminase large subunit-like protein